ncbi:hypothetical protein QBC36DRAFT_346717 [Triangularia setosa]|uniref:Uncharacterized protein n=1 Tax=Triangularia setosa TaxID=2587417 RepID=A0AAN7A5B7_9PEZI|nr:hypothetical protein QBC36DRAFT_346717 [Podospora setosa]
MSPNRQDYQRRVEFVHGVLQIFNFGENLKVEPIQYDPECPFSYNNYIYRIALPSALNSDHPGRTGTNELIMRLTNSDSEGMIAIIALASSALKSHQSDIVPRLYGWGGASGESTQGIKGFGDSAFDDSGEITSAAMPFGGLGPWQAYEEYPNSYIKGWHAKCLRKRLDAFVAHGLSAQLEALSAAAAAAAGKVIVHGDFNTGRSQKTKIRGFHDPLPPITEDGVKWEDSKAWEHALEVEGVNRPRIIQGIEKVSDVDTLLSSIRPWAVNPTNLGLWPEERIIKVRSEKEELLSKLLMHLGFRT